MNDMKPILALSLILLLTACATTNRDWQKAQSLNTVQAYNEFSNAHPQSEFTTEAKSRICDLDWKETKQLNTLKSYQGFISKYPESVFNQEAKARIEDLEWQETRSLLWGRTTLSG